MRLALSTLLFGAAAAILAPKPAAAQSAGTPLQVGTMAPDFAVPGATRHGVLRDPITLTAYRGKTVVLAFFYRARTPG
jgi:hypothetical protein